jgi:hypothetical protein
LDWRNITRPSSSSTNTSKAHSPVHLSTVARAGIGVGTGVGVLTMAAASIFLYFRKRSSHTGVVKNTHPGRDYRAPGALNINPRYGLFQLDSNEVVAELSANSHYELPELTTPESAIEMPTRYSFY